MHVYQGFPKTLQTYHKLTILLHMDSALLDHKKVKILNVCINCDPLGNKLF